MYYKPSPVTIEKYDDGRDEWAVRDACGGLDRYRTGILKQLITEDWEKYAEGGTIDNSGITPADLQKQIWNLTARIAKLGDIESRAASDEIEMLMKQRRKLQSMALNHGDVVMAQGGELHRRQEEKFKYGGYMADGGEVEIEERLEELREELRAGTISYSELAELQSLSKYIDKNDTELLEAAGVPEFEEDDYAKGGYMAKGGATEHGLKMGDTIWADQFWDNTVIVDNPKTGRAVVNLETGKRKEQGKI